MIIFFLDQILVPNLKIMYNFILKKDFMGIVIYMGRGINFNTIIPIKAVKKCPKKIFFGCANGLSGQPYNKTIDDPNDAIKNKPKGVL